MATYCDLFLTTDAQGPNNDLDALDDEDLAVAALIGAALVLLATITLRLKATK